MSKISEHCKYLLKRKSRMYEEVDRERIERIHLLQDENRKLKEQLIAKNTLSEWFKSKYHEFFNLTNLMGNYIYMINRDDDLKNESKNSILQISNLLNSLEGIMEEILDKLMEVK